MLANFKCYEIHHSEKQIFLCQCLTWGNYFYQTSFKKHKFFKNLFEQIKNVFKQIKNVFEQNSFLKFTFEIEINKKMPF